jgi:hypothetical protein
MKKTTLYVKLIYQFNINIVLPDLPPLGVGCAIEVDPLEKETDPKTMKRIPSKMKQILKFRNGYINFQCFFDPPIPKKIIFLMKKNPKP